MLVCYSIFDSKAESYSPPFFAGSDGLACRMVSDAASDPGTTLFKHPADFTLYRLGSFDPVSGLITAEIPPKFVANVTTLFTVFPKEGSTNGSAISNDESVLARSESDDTAEFVSSV